MFNKEEEINFLEKTIKSILSLNLDNLDFVKEAALIRHFEVIGGIAKELERSGSKVIAKNNLWKSSISMRDKISHSYYTLSMEPLIIAVKDLEELLGTIEDIRKEFNI